MDRKTVKAIAYARTSLVDMEPEIQRSQIREFARLHSMEIVAELTDQISGSKERRPGLDEALKLLQTGKANTLIVASIDRLSRSLSHLITVVRELTQNGNTVIFLRENLRLSNDDPQGQLLLSLIGAMSQFEVEIIRARTRQGLKLAQLRGVKLGRPRKVSPAIEADIVRLRGEGVPIREIARRLRPSISRGSVQAVLRRVKKPA